LRKRLIPVAILGCLALGPGAAEAATLTEYDVVIEGSGTWERHGATAGSYDRQATFTWRTTMPAVMFEGKELRQTAPTKISSAAAEARDDVVLPTPTGTFTGFCKGGPTVARAGELGRSLLPAGGGREALDIRVVGGIHVEMRECGGDPVVSPGTLVLDAGGRAMGDGAFDARVEMPHEAIGMGKIIELLEGTASGQRCPRWTNASSSCALRWKATVTFTRTRQQQVAPPPGPDPVKDPIPLPEGPPPLDDVFIPIKTKLSASGASVTVVCPAGCSGTAKALPLRGSKALARKRFTAPAARPTRVKLRFRAHGRRAVRVVIEAEGERAKLTLRRS
jgi:hypothetical protein